MTRVNVVDPLLLTDQHLHAECREINHVFSYVERYYTPKKVFNIAADYTLNTGHVQFFADKLKFIYNRKLRLEQERFMRNVIRGKYGVGKDVDATWDDSFDAELWQQRYDAFPQHLKNDYIPTANAIHVNVERIVERIMDKPTWYRYLGKCNVLVTPEDIQTVYNKNNPSFYSTGITQ